MFVELENKQSRRSVVSEEATKLIHQVNPWLMKTTLKLFSFNKAYLPKKRKEEVVITINS